MQRCANLVYVRFTCNFHRDHANAVFARQLEYPGQALAPHSLKGIRTGARLVGAHARADLPVRFQAGKRLLDKCAGIDRIQSGKGLQRFLRKRDAVIAEADIVFVRLMPAKNPEFDRHDYSGVLRRRARTAAARFCNSFSVSAQPMQASVTETPYSAALPSTMSCRPGFR